RFFWPENGFFPAPVFPPKTVKAGYKTTNPVTGLFQKLKFWESFYFFKNAINRILFIIQCVINKFS
ncbi:MAG: hypothetical protein LBI86_12465, partial [Treponema sp.]|nr:hypothetical protein [Treponema sp.]